MSSRYLRWLCGGVILFSLVGCTTRDHGIRTMLADAIDEGKEITRTDVQRGYEIAQRGADLAGMACSTALLAKLDASIAAAAPLEPAGVFSAYMQVRQLKRQMTGPRDEAVHNACAPLFVDFAVTVGKLGLKFMPGGGVADTILGR